MQKYHLFLSKGNTGIKWSRGGRKGYSETSPPWDPSHGQAPNPDTVTDARLCLQTEA